jgi:outer membrane receptor for ferrienterochelin and colicin
MHRPLATGVFAVLIAGSAAAQTPPQNPDTSAKSLGAVVVSATRATTTVDRIALHATLVTQEEIKKSPAQTLDQLLRDIPGVNIPGAPYYTTDPTGQQTKMRGVTNSKVLVLVDGAPVHDPFYTTTQWFKVPLSSIERIEVVRGGASSIWGNLAVAGVINIITKKPIDNSGTLDINRQSMNTTNAALSKNFVVGSSLGIRLSGDLLHTDGYQTTPDAFLSTVPGKGASSAKNGNVQIAAYYTPASGFSAYARAGYHQTNEDIGGYQFGNNLQKSPDGAAGFTNYFSDRVKLDGRAWGQYVDFDKSNGAGCYLVSATSCGTTLTGGSPLVQYANSHDDNPYRELGASTILSLTDMAKFASIQTGADFRTVGGEDRATTYNRPTTNDGASATINRTNFGRGTQRFAGVFGQFRATPLSRLETTLSLRYDYWTNTNGDAQMTKYANGAPGTTLGGPIADSHEGSFNPSLSARFDATSHLSFRGAAYKAFRAPGLNNLYRSFSSTTSITIANANLQPETLRGGELGADVRLSHATLGATYFRYDTKALIASYKIPDAASAPTEVTAICGADLSNCPATVNLNTNGQNATSHGLELVGNWRATKALDVDAGYTFTNSHYISTTTGDPVGAQLGAVPKHLGTLGVTWQATPKWHAYVGARHTDALFLDVNHTIEQPSFTLYNASTSYQLAKQLEVYGSVTNLSNEKYSDNSTTSAAGQTLGMLRSFTTGVRVRF